MIVNRKTQILLKLTKRNKRCMLWNMERKWILPFKGNFIM